MKKMILLLMALAGTLTMQAENAYAYLTLETTDGAKASIPVESLTLTISGNTLTTDSQTFLLSNLSRMYFSMTHIYDLQGHKVSKEQMKKGVYVVKTKNKTYKMIVR